MKAIIQFPIPPDFEIGDEVDVVFTGNNHGQFTGFILTHPEKPDMGTPVPIKELDHLVFDQVPNQLRE